MKTIMKYRKIMIIVICILLCIGFCVWQNNAIEITNYTFSSTEISPSFEGYRIVQISDLHNKSFGKETNRLIEEIKTLEPDMIALTGDLVDSNHTNVDVAIDFLKQAVNFAPCYYITGNHELWLEEAERNDLIKKITQTGTMILDDAVVEISLQTKYVSDRERDDITNVSSLNEQESIFTSFILVGLDDKSIYVYRTCF